jgi:predicted nuclease with RNAse H fold
MTVDELAERGIRVKPLEWKMVKHGSCRGDWVAETLYCSLRLVNTVYPPARWHEVTRASAAQGGPLHETLEAAKAAAEADHAARIAAQIEDSREACERPEVTG